jgi:hypothetical protein
MEQGTRVKVNAPSTPYHGMTGVYIGPHYGFSKIKLDKTGEEHSFSGSELIPLPVDPVRQS